MKINPIASASLWVIGALLFNAGIYFHQGPAKALEFLTGYLIELSLSIDNLFVFFLIFSHFKVGVQEQSKILFWGVLGAQVMRAVFILGGVALLNTLGWVIYVFGALLIFSGAKLFFKTEKTVDIEQSFFMRVLRKIIPGNLSIFWVVLIAVEFTDLIFAVDSIPAVLAITKDSFIVYSSNIFAILGLRAMYFVVAPFVDKFEFLHYTLGVILVFVGVKMLLDQFWHMPVALALGFIIVVLLISISASFLRRRTV